MGAAAGETTSTFSAAQVAELGGPGWLASSRRAAFERFQASELPTSEAEVWRYSRIDDLDLTRYHPAVAGPAESRSALVAEVRASTGGGPYSALVVTVDGLVAHAEVTPEAAGALDCVPLRERADGASLVEVLDAPGDAIHSLAAAFRVDAAVIRVAAGAVLDAPVVVVHLAATPGAATFPATLVEMGAGSSSQVVELHRSGEGAALVVPRSRLLVGDGAHLDLVTVQQLGAAAWQLGHQSSAVAADGRLRSFTVALGGDYARARIDASLDGAGGSSDLLAAFFGRADQVLDFRTQQAHVGPRTTSDLVFKGAVDDNARSVYTGLIQVLRGAKGTNAFQTNRNLVLSGAAHADSVPNLDIAENDVRCSHASAVGPIDPDQRYYLESRGIPPEAADRLIVMGFFDDLLDRLPVAALRPALRLALAERVGLGGLGDEQWGDGLMGVEVRLCRREELEPGTARRFDVEGHRIALVRIEDDFYALGDRCSHANYSLSEGEVMVGERAIECWKHGSSFSLLTGEPESLPATKAVPVYEVRAQGDDVMVTLP